LTNHFRSLYNRVIQAYCHRDFTSDEFRDQPYHMEYGTFRNKNSILRKKGIVDLAYNSVLAFYTLKGIKFGRPKTMTQLMTSDHMGVSSVIDVTNYNSGIKTANNIDIDLDLPIYREIHKLPPERRALHDMHYKFHASDIWKILRYGYEIDTSNQAIILPPIDTNDLKLTITVYPTDTVTVIVGCSDNPVAITTEDLIHLSSSLTRAEERLSRWVDECGSSFADNYETIHIPDHNTWIVTLWHFGVDSYSYKEYAKEEYCCTWQEGKRALIRAYSKCFQTKDRNKVYGNRKEIQERPYKPHANAIKEKMNQETVGQE
jgi:hypothetical protein